MKSYMLVVTVFTALSQPAFSMRDDNDSSSRSYSNHSSSASEENSENLKDSSKITPNPKEEELQRINEELASLRQKKADIDNGTGDYEPKECVVMDRKTAASLQYKYSTSKGATPSGFAIILQQNLINYDEYTNYAKKLTKDKIATDKRIDVLEFKLRMLSENQ